MIPRLKTHYSLLTSTIRIEDLGVAKKMGYDTLAITDTHTISGAVAFHNACKKLGIKGLLGMEIAVRNSDESIYTLTLICRSHAAWLKLLKIVAIANSDDNFKSNPSIDIDVLRGIVDPADFVCVDGYVGSLLYEQIFDGPKAAMFESDYTGAAKHLKRHWTETAAVHVSNMKRVFGDGYAVEVNRLENENFPVGLLTSNCVQDIATGICPFFGGSTAHYVDHPEDQKLLLCVKMKCSLREFEEKLKHPDHCSYLKFSRNDSFRLREHAELVKVYGDLDVLNVSELCSEFEILSKPRLPHFKCNGAEIDYLRQLCRDGWRNKLLPSGKVTSAEGKETYRLRIEEELRVIEEAGIAGYFLIVQDIVNNFNKDYLLGCGRGSAAGCLVSYLTNITGVDPIEYGLLFERFYSRARSYGPHIAFEELSYLSDF